MKNVASNVRFLRALRIAFVAAAAGLGPVGGALAQQAFPTPAAAADAFVDAVARHDDVALKSVIGRDYAKYLPHANADDTTDFLEAWAKSHRIVPAGDDKAYLEVGRNGWTLPIPIVRTAGGWQFDTRATSEELRIRRESLLERVTRGGFAPEADREVRILFCVGGHEVRQPCGFNEARTDARREGASGRR
mgnify:CR=1 FL=1